MAIQPFAMQGQVANIMLPSEAIQGAAQAKAAQNRNAMFEMEVKDKQNLDQAYRESGGDINAMMKNPNLGFEAGTRLQEISSENVKAQNTAKIGQLDFMLKGAEYSAQLAGSAQNQADWDRVRQHAIDTLGPQAAETFPAEFSESARNQVLQGAMSFKDKLDMQRADLQMQREDRMANQQDRMYQLAVGREGRLAAGGGGDLKPQYDSNRGGYFDPNTKQFVALTGEGGAPLPSKSAAPKPLPPAALKMQQEALDAIGTAGTINADLASVEGLIDTGKLDFGPVSNLKNKALNAAGASTEQSRNFATFQSTLEKLRNDSLRLNKGVQTDGDAQRAWNELLQNINDPEVVKQRLAEIQKINERGAALQQMNVDQIRANYGADPLDASGRLNQPSAIGAQNSADDFTSLWN